MRSFFTADASAPKLNFIDMLPSQYRLTDRRDFQKAYSRGIQKKGKFGKLVVFSRDEKGPSRFGISVSAKVGNATVRNKVKRRVRDIFRSLLSGIGAGKDIIYVVWSAEGSYQELRQEITTLLS